MLSRWIQENTRFLYIVGGAALILLIFQWLFVWGPRRTYQVQRRNYTTALKKLKSLYRKEPPVGLQRSRRDKERDVVKAALSEALAVYGGRPATPFVLPPSEEAAAPNYYFGRRTAVVAEIEQAAIDGAVNLSDPQLGLPQQLPRSADNVATVRTWLWNLQVVRRGVLTAIAAGVDTIEPVQEAGGDHRSITEGSEELYGQPLLFRVTGPSDTVARWLESLQQEGSFLVMVGCRIKRNQNELGVVTCRAVLMGVNRRTIAAAESDE